MDKNASWENLGFKKWGFLLEQILVIYKNKIINPPTITRNIVRGIQEDWVIIRLQIEIKIVWSKRIIPKEIGCEETKIMEELNIANSINVLIISMNSLI